MEERPRGQKGESKGRREMFYSSGLVQVSEDLSHKARDGVEDLEDSVRFLSYCKKHRQSKTERGTLTQRIASSKQELGYYPPINSSGCARTGKALVLGGLL